MTIRKSTTRWRHRQRITSQAIHRRDDVKHVHHCRLCGCRIHPSCEICGECVCEQEVA